MRLLLLLLLLVPYVTLTCAQLHSLFVSFSGGEHFEHLQDDVRRYGRRSQATRENLGPWNHFYSGRFQGLYPLYPKYRPCRFMSLIIDHELYVLHYRP